MDGFLSEIAQIDQPTQNADTTGVYIMKNSHKRIALIGIVGAMILFAGCIESDSGVDGAKDIANETSESISPDDVGESYWFEIALTEENQQNLVRQHPPFTMENSLERENLIRRYKYLNDQNNVHHVYMLSNDGKVIDYEVAQGKVSSVNSKLTNNVQIVRAQDCDSHQGGEGACFKTVESPQMDGSYGTNGNAIFFFTTDGNYVEYNGIYVVSEVPKEITTEVTLVEEAGS